MPRHAQLPDPKRIRFVAKAPAQPGDAVQIARAALLVVDLETLWSRSA
jgi:hypothetical protein